MRIKYKAIKIPEKEWQYIETVLRVVKMLYSLKCKGVLGSASNFNPLLKLWQRERE